MFIWTQPTPRQPEVTQRLLESLTPETPKSMFLGSSLLGRIQESFCPPGWLTSKFSVKGASGHFCVHSTPGNKVATQRVACSWFRNAPSFAGLQECDNFLQRSLHLTRGSRRTHLCESKWVHTVVVKQLHVTNTYARKPCKGNLGFSNGLPSRIENPTKTHKESNTT